MEGETWFLSSVHVMLSNRGRDDRQRKPALPHYITLLPSHTHKYTQKSCRQKAASQLSNHSAKSLIWDSHLPQTHISFSSIHTEHTLTHTSTHNLSFTQLLKQVPLLSLLFKCQSDLKSAAFLGSSNRHICPCDFWLLACVKQVRTLGIIYRFI